MKHIERFKGWVSRPVWRITLAVLLIIVGLAPVGAPILSDANRARPATEIEPSVQATAFAYRFKVEAVGETGVQRSGDGGATWQRVASIPGRVAQLTPVPGNEDHVYAIDQDSAWGSSDAGATWSRLADLPSRPLSMAVVGGSTPTLYVGTESMGLLQSADGATTWRSSDVETWGTGAPVAITALAISADDPLIVYAASAQWLGTSRARLSPLAISLTVDGGRSWFELERLSLRAGPTTALSVVPGRRLSVKSQDQQGEHLYGLALSPELIATLDDGQPTRRAAAARAMALLGDRAALPALLGHLADADAVAGDQIVVAAAALGGDQTVAALRPLLSSEAESLRARAALGLGLLADDGSTAQLARMLAADPSPLARRRAAEALGAVGSPEALAALTAGLGDTAPAATRHAAMIGLERAGERAAEPLTALLAAAESRGGSGAGAGAGLRRDAATVLGYLRSPEATDGLALALADPAPEVRREAAWALGQIATLEARHALAAALRAETEPAVHAAATEALARADLVLEGSSYPRLTAMERVISGLSHVPASRWTLLVLSLALAIALLRTGDTRSGHAQRA